MNESVRREECRNTASLALAYLSARRRQPAGPLLLNVVRNVDGQAVDFGLPSEWGPGVAWSVLRGELWVDVLQLNVDFVDLEVDELECPAPISRSVSHPSDLFRRPSLNLGSKPMSGAKPLFPHELALATLPDVALAIHVPESAMSPATSSPTPSTFPSPPAASLRPLTRSRTDPLSPPSAKARPSATAFVLPSPRTKRVCTLLPGLTPADVAFVEALEVGVVAEKGQRSAMEDYYVCVPDFDKVVKEKLLHLEEGLDLELSLSRAASSAWPSFPPPICSSSSTPDSSSVSCPASCVSPSTLSASSERVCALSAPSAWHSQTSSSSSASSSSSLVSFSSPLPAKLTPLSEEPRCPPCCATCLPGFAYFAVFDGHGGQGCAAYCSQSIHKDIAIRYASSLANVSNEDVLLDAILAGFLDAERVWLGLALNREVGVEKSGSTAAVVLFHGQRLYVAHCGDTRVVLSRKGMAIELTKDHTCKNAAESERVLRDGGKVVYGAVNGSIEVTRSIGDYEDSGRKTPGLSAVPEISKFMLTPEDEFIIIACDGLWDVMNSEQAVGYARISLREDNDIQKACADLVQKALHSSEDNVTVLMVGFTKPGTGSSGPFIVDKVCPSFNKKTFLCDRCQHQYEGRNKLEQCPYCAGRKLCGQIECKHCFVRSFASFEDKTKIQCWLNGNNEEHEALLVSASSKEKFWFQCNVCSHRFEAVLSDVTAGVTWCPFCSGSSRCSDSVCSSCGAHVVKPSAPPRPSYIPPHLRRAQARQEAEAVAAAIVSSIVEHVCALRDRL